MQWSCLDAVSVTVADGTEHWLETDDEYWLITVFFSRFSITSMFYHNCRTFHFCSMISSRAYWAGRAVAVIWVLWLKPIVCPPTVSDITFLSISFFNFYHFLMLLNVIGRDLWELVTWHISTPTGPLETRYVISNKNIPREMVSSAPLHLMPVWHSSEVISCIYNKTVVCTLGWTDTAKDSSFMIPIITSSHYCVH